MPQVEFDAKPFCEISENEAKPKFELNEQNFIKIVFRKD